VQKDICSDRQKLVLSPLPILASHSSTDIEPPGGFPILGYRNFAGELERKLRPLGRRRNSGCAGVANEFYLIIIEA
jgi:hypothetical protein